ncbi:MAG: dihydropyrimidinase [Oscillibacter sp.]|nr:dihydropyrimidinase [Oscillibacter sp.]
MRTLFRGGAVVSGSGIKEADVIADGEKITEVGRRCRGAFDRAVNASGCLLFPGFIDAYTHFDSDEGGTATADDFYTGSKAALRGGATTILGVAHAKAGETLRGAFARRRAGADAQIFCDYGLHMALSEWNDGTHAQARELFREGASSFLLRADALGDRQFYEALRVLSAYGGTCAAECGNQAVSDALAAERLAAGDVSPAAYPATRPAALEAEGVSRALRIAQTARAPLVIRRVSSAEALSEVKRARRRGQAAFAETCARYLTLDEGAYRTGDAALYVCAPPLRPRSDQSALWLGLRLKEIQFVSSDHRAFTKAQKEAAHDDFTRIPSGLPGAGECAELLYSYGVAERRISAADMCRALCENPAKLYGLWPRKGRIAPGADADIVIYDPGDSHVITARDSVSPAGHTPYEGFATVGGIRQVWLRGTPIVDRGEFLPVTPKGAYLYRGKCSLRTERG